jgi:hypothetical protein
MNAKELYELSKTVEQLWLKKEPYTPFDISEIKEYLSQYYKILNNKLIETEINGI